MSVYDRWQYNEVGVAAAHAEQLWQTGQASPAWAERANLKLYWLLGVVWDGLGTVEPVRYGKKHAPC